MNTESKIQARGNLKRLVEGHRREGRKIGFTCGAFDLLHAGHVRYLEKAKERCDILVVAVNTDESVRGYKGEKRPVIGQDERMRLVAGLAAVDYVTPLPELRPADLISLLKPHFYFKGGDYSVDALRSKDVLEQWGGQAVVLPLSEGRSTTAVIDKIVQLHIAESVPHVSHHDKAVFLDRDGTINEDISFLHNPGKFRLLPHAAEGLRQMQEMGFRLVIVTNQQGIGLGYFPEEDFFKVNSAMFRALTPYGVVISKIYFCPHSEADACQCRKPKTELIERARKDMNLNLDRCFFVGDRPEDIETGRRAGCKTILVGRKRQADTEAHPDFHAADLLEAAGYMAEHEG